MAENELTPTPDEAFRDSITRMLQQANGIRDHLNLMIANGRPAGRTLTRINNAVEQLEAAQRCFNYDVIKRLGTKPGPKTRANAEYERDMA